MYDKATAGCGVGVLGSVRKHAPPRVEAEPEGGTSNERPRERERTRERDRERGGEYEERESERGRKIVEQEGEEGREGRGTTSTSVWECVCV